MLDKKQVQIRNVIKINITNKIMTQNRLDQQSTELLIIYLA